MEEIHLPSHVAIIMDGNGRWAEKKGKPRSYGHKAGSDNVDRIVSYAFKIGINTLTLYAFSSENWQRPKEEVDELMRLLEIYFKKFTKKAIKNKVKLVVLGDTEALSEKLKKVIADSYEKTKQLSDKTLNICINYGGRQEIVKAVKEINNSGEEISVDNISKHLYTCSCKDPDFIIRTGGEIRLSNFLLYQSAYAELYFTDVLWPDFDEVQFDLAMQNYSKRKRKFGKVDNV